MNSFICMSRRSTGIAESAASRQRSAVRACEEIAPDVVRTFRSARRSRPEGLHYSDFFAGSQRSRLKTLISKLGSHDGDPPRRFINVLNLDSNGRRERAREPVGPFDGRHSPFERELIESEIVDFDRFQTIQIHMIEAQRSEERRVGKECRL